MSQPLQDRLTQLELQHEALRAEYDALKVRKSEAVHQVFYRIAERATAGLSFYDFLHEIHALLGALLPSKNFYVAICNHQHNTVSFPYYVDEKDGSGLQLDDVPHRRGLTEFVLRTEEPQLIDAERFKLLQTTGDITEASGDLSFTSWLGVPLLMHGRVSGVLVVQSYELGVSYTAAHADMLGFVANHVSSAIERYQAIEALRQSEVRYRSVIDNIGVGVVVVVDGRMVFVNPSMVNIVGHSREFLLSTPFMACIHPEDVDIVVQRHQRRLQGEPVEPFYTFRVITQAGEVRQLELSAVIIEWDNRDATLLFVMDATARLEAEIAQKKAVNQQTELNDMKTRFIAMTSHEFRTPLASIHGSVELLMHYEVRMPAARKHQVLQNINDAVERMTHMLGNVMQIGRADAGQLQFRPKPMDLTRFCMALIDELRDSMPRQFAQVQLVLDLGPENESLVLDEALIRNIVGNLLSNAIKYSPSGGTVRLSARNEPGQLVITVADEGIGIPLADQAQLFQNFHRAANVGSIAGTGLGLSIVKDAVDCHQGQIEMHSVEGEGSQFTVMLPTSTAPA
jgi:PAS domain S-box-containing protein